MLLGIGIGWIQPRVVEAPGTDQPSAGWNLLGLGEGVAGLPVEAVARNRQRRLAAAVGVEKLELEPGTAEVHVRRQVIQHRVALEAVGAGMRGIVRAGRNL